MLAKIRDGIGNQVLLLIIAYYTRGIEQSINDVRRAGFNGRAVDPLLKRLRRLRKIERALQTNRWRHDKPAGL